MNAVDGVPVKRHKDGDCKASTISSFSGTYDPKSSGTNSPTIIYDGDCYDTYGSIYLGRVMIFKARSLFRWSRVYGTVVRA